MGEGVEAFKLSYSYKKKAKTHILSSRRKVWHVELQVLIAFSRGRRCCRWAALHIVKVRAAVLRRAKSSNRWSCKILVSCKKFWRFDDMIALSEPFLLLTNPSPLLWINISTISLSKEYSYSICTNCIVTVTDIRKVPAYDWLLWPEHLPLTASSGCGSCWFNTRWESSVSCSSLLHTHIIYLSLMCVWFHFINKY